jgi:hypothetical protein
MSFVFFHHQVLRSLGCYFYYMVMLKLYISFCMVSHAWIEVTYMSSTLAIIAVPGRVLSALFFPMIRLYPKAQRLHKLAKIPLYFS